MSSHQATPEQWAMLEERSAPEYDNTILELRARVEALEANSKPIPNSSPIRSSLVERVQRAIHDVEFPHGNDEARAADSPTKTPEGQAARRPCDCVPRNRMSNSSAWTKAALKAATPAITPPRRSPRSSPSRNGIKLYPTIELSR